MWGRNAGAHLDGHQHGGRKPIETSVLEFCYKSVNLSLEKLKNIKIILFCNTRTVQVAKFPEISPRNKSLFNQLGRHANAASRESLEIQAQFITKPRTHSEQNFA